MASVGGTQSTSPGVSNLRRLLGPRPVLLTIFALSFVGLVAAFAILGERFQSDSRRQSQQRFGGEASLSAQLTASLFTSSATSSSALTAKTFGGKTVTDESVDTLATSAHAGYLIILDKTGKVLAASATTPKSVLAKVAKEAHVLKAIAGQATLSDILPAPAPLKGKLFEWALPFPTPFGQRIAVEGLDTKSLTVFMNAYLARVQTAGGGTAFVLDSGNHVVAVGSGTIATGGSPKAGGLVSALGTKSSGTYHYNGSERYFATAPVDGTTWRVVLAVRTSLLYPGLAGSKSWLLYAVLAAVGLAGAVSIFLFRRSLSAGALLENANTELNAMNTTLEARVAERTAAAEDRAQELARSNAELEQFSSIASHDLQEPLRKIRMFGDRLRERLGDNLPEEPAGDLQRIESAAARMQRLINDLLAFSRVTHRGNEFETVDLGEVADEVAGDLEARVVELDARIEVGDLPVIEADKTQMRQLIQNLVGNALKFHRVGEAPVVRITSKTIAAQTPRFPGESTAGDRCVITVSDNGIGFDEKHAERVFGAFERLHNRSEYEGTGIGLSIARKIVWRHGGHITAAGVPDEGATFTVTLPLAQSTPSSNGTSSNGTSSNGTATNGGNGGHPS